MIPYNTEDRRSDNKGFFIIFIIIILFIVTATLTSCETRQERVNRLHPEYKVVVIKLINIIPREQ